jgi:hypothetical protein
MTHRGDAADVRSASAHWDVWHPFLATALAELRRVQQGLARVTLPRRLRRGTLYACVEVHPDAALRRCLPLIQLELAALGLPSVVAARTEIELDDTEDRATWPEQFLLVALPEQPPRSARASAAKRKRRGASSARTQAPQADPPPRDRDASIQ